MIACHNHLARRTRIASELSVLMPLLSISCPRVVAPALQQSVDYRRATSLACTQRELSSRMPVCLLRTADSPRNTARRWRASDRYLGTGRRKRFAHRHSNASTVAHEIAHWTKIPKSVYWLTDRHDVWEKCGRYAIYSRVHVMGKQYPDTRRASSAMSCGDRTALNDRKRSRPTAPRRSIPALHLLNG